MRCFCRYMRCFSSLYAVFLSLYSIFITSCSVRISLILYSVLSSLSSVVFSWPRFHPCAYSKWRPIIETRQKRDSREVIGTSFLVEQFSDISRQFQYGSVNWRAESAVKINWSVSWARQLCFYTWMTSNSFIVLLIRWIFKFKLSCPWLGDKILPPRRTGCIFWQLAFSSFTVWFITLFEVVRP